LNLLLVAKARKPYLLRRVASVNELLEKILIFDAGLDDRAVEVYKLRLRQGLGNRAGLEGDIFFAGECPSHERRIQFVIVGDHGAETFDTPTIDALVESTSDLLKPHRTDRDNAWLKINSNWAAALEAESNAAPKAEQQMEVSVGAPAARRLETKQALIWVGTIALVALVIVALTAIGHAEVAGYFAFVGLCLFGAPVIAFVLLPILGPMILIAWTPFRRVFQSFRSEEAARASTGLVGGIFAGITIFLIAWAVHHVFESNPNWLTGLGCAIQLFAAPKVWNAKYAIPTSIVVFFVMSLFLLP
jgi:hypothetical protein